MDAADRDRIAEAKEELDGILSSQELQGVDVLVFANKTDQPNAMSAEEVAKVLDMRQYSLNHHWQVQPTCAPSGVGLYEGLDWLVKRVKQSKAPQMAEYEF